MAHGALKVPEINWRCFNLKVLDQPPLRTAAHGIGLRKNSSGACFRASRCARSLQQRISEDVFSDPAAVSACTQVSS